ncbi:hypothetical protein J6590_039496 [Homalodisca vitripennis]|nr:hypothetical protein J6590_039496 [Homalodisca vitripennis]
MVAPTGHEVGTDRFVRNTEPLDLLRSIVRRDGYRTGHTSRGDVAAKAIHQSALTTGSKGDFRRPLTRGVPLELELFQISAPLLERSGAALRDSRNSSSSNLIYSYNYSLGASVELSAVAYNLLTNQNKPVSVSVGVLT